MNAKKYRELKVAHRYLSECELCVPHGLLVELSQQILEEDRRRRAARMAKMSDEELALLDRRVSRTVRVCTSDGLLIQSRTNAATFGRALSYIGLERIHALGLNIGSHPLLAKEPSPRKRRRGYERLAPGFLVYRSLDSARMVRVLQEIDEALRLSLHIELV